MRLITLLLLALTVMFASLGCVMTPKQPALHDFGLGIARHDIEPSKIRPNITVDAPTWLWDNRIRFRLLYASPTKIGFYALDQWIASPPELFQQQLVKSNLPSCQLRIQLLEFEQQFDSPDKAHVVLHFSVDATSLNNRQNLGNQEYQLQLTTESPDASGAVKAFSQLIKQAGQKIDGWAKNKACVSE
jgi:cholesterol transport system auxiliary component